MGKVKNAVDKGINTAKDAVIMAADGISNAAQLSPRQVNEIESKRRDYLTAEQSAEQSGLDTVAKCLSAIHSEVTQNYLPRINKLYDPVAWTDTNFSPENRIRFFDITKWTVDSSEDSLDKLVNVYQVLSEELCSVALIYSRKADGCTVTMAVENRRESDQPVVASKMSERFRDALRGNFPGVELEETHTGVPLLLRERISNCAVAAVSNLASEKSEKFISQSIEKLLDGIIPKSETDEYSLVLLAVPAYDLRARQGRLCRLYTELSPYATWQKNHGSSESLSATAVANASANAGMGIPQVLNVGIQFGRSAIAARSWTENDGVTETYTDYAVKHAQELLENQVKRMDQCAALGMWDFAAYVISPSYSVAQNVAHMYLSLTQGEESYMEQAAINIWEQAKAAPLLPWLRALQHPQFALAPKEVEENQDCLIYPLKVTATSALSGKELARALNFPRRSVSGLPVYECVPFGREVVQYTQEPNKRTIPLGRIYHMRHAEAAWVPLDRKSLTAHTFITGSTGAGKSNTIYTLLDKLCLDGGSDTKFLVIEPAKGEYKEALGGYPGVQVYGTNPYKTPLLRLNPFSFPEDTHVLEHIDRLVEVFNACWPMYAAMPAVLKAAVEQAYKVCGWSLNTSRCTGIRRFPTFRDVMRALPAVVDSKGFSNDTQGDYKGALLTRLESLTNGINGQVLCAHDDLDGEALFDQNVIVDLSRVGSSETKALLMGVLILKLQEHRMAQRVAGETQGNEGLRHITVLEEAHNLLRRTSTEQSQESSNLQGKSVEMLTNAIAEMRTYGEGFIIADQSPGLLDMAVIRNTNTKIILRLPDESDRVLVGKAAGLNDEQIVELSRLDTGVAAVYQNHWLEPVLCAISYFDSKKFKPFSYSGQPSAAPSASFDEHIFDMLLENSVADAARDQEAVDQIKTWIDRQATGRAVKKLLHQVLIEREPLSDRDKKFVLYCLARGTHAIQAARRTTVAPEEARRVIDMQIMEQFEISEQLAQEIRNIVLLYAAEHVRKLDEMQYRELMQMGDVR